MRYLFLFLICSLSVNAQLKGTITDDKNQPIPYVNIYIENSYTGTTSNDQGDYELALSKPCNRFCKSLCNELTRN